MKQNIYDDADFFARYQEYRKSEKCLNSALEQPYLRSTLPDISGFRILDIGSGAGTFAKYAIEQGASMVAGVDISRRMCDVAEKTLVNFENVTVFNSAIEDFVWNGLPFDLIVSSLALHYVENLGEVVKNVSSWLRPGGYFTITLNHPIYTASLKRPGGSEELDANTYWKEGPRIQELLNFEVLKYHKTLENYFNAFVAAGLSIAEIKDLSPFEIGLDSWEGDEGLSRRPIFMLIDARKIES